MSNGNAECRMQEQCITATIQITIMGGEGHLLYKSQQLVGYSTHLHKLLLENIICCITFF